MDGKISSVNRWATALIVVAIVSGGDACAADKVLLNPEVTQETINKTICRVGYTSHLRPDTAYTNGLKQKLLAERGEAGANASKYELDHQIPLSLGGSPRSPDNLVLQPWDEARTKDKDEVRMFFCVCRGAVPLADAQAAMLDWKGPIDQKVYGSCETRHHHH